MDSFSDRLKQKRSALAGERPPLYLPVPGYGGEIAFKFHMIEWEELKQLHKQLERQQDAAGEDQAELDSQINLVCRSCAEIVFKDTTGWRSFSNPVRLDSTVGALLDFPAENAKQALVGLLGGKTVAISGIQAKLVRWLTMEDADVAEEFVGESLSAADTSTSLREDISMGSAG